MRPEMLQSASSVTRRAAYRFFQDAGPAGIGIVLLSWPTCEVCCPPPSGMGRQVAWALAMPGFEGTQILGLRS
jgi:hypothetical protein